MDFKYPKEEKLKSNKTIETLFTKGKSIANFPVRIVYVAQNELQNHQIGVSVSKKYFKKAVTRNYFKRVLRESYRINKNELQLLEKKYAIMLLYQTKDVLDFNTINQKVIHLFKKMQEKESENIELK